MSTLEGITFLEHMTDAEYAVQAATLEHAFELCGLALEHTMVDIQTIGDNFDQTTKAKGNDQKASSTNFLNS